MDTAAATRHPQIAESVNPTALFEQVQEAFSDLFRIEELIGAGEVRALFRARHTVLGRPIALRLHLQPDGPSRSWFEHESVLLGKLDHPGIRPVHTAGYLDRWAYRVTKWIEGESLLEAMERGPRPIPDVLLMARDLLSALDYVHGEGIVLRRINPTSLMLTSARRSVITDLRWSNPCLALADPDTDPASEPYLAPEARGDRDGEPGSDVYSAAAVLYYAVTGTVLPSDPLEIRPPSELRRACPRSLERVILHALQPESDKRYLNATDMGEDLLADLGEFELHFSTNPVEADAADDPDAWEGRLRRALGDDYELLGLLGQGAFGRVYRVRDLALEREVALKVLHPYLTSEPQMVERFLREARLAAQVRHPNIVDVFDTGRRAGLLWYIMAYVPGDNLAQLVQRDGPLSVEHAARLLRQSLSALQHAHGHGLIHRDLKPENILIELPEWNLQVTDFGLALAIESLESEGGLTSRSGTPEFAAPEQLLGEPVDLRADLYSIAIVTLFGLTGQPPFGGGTIESILARQAVGQLPDVGSVRDDVPEGLLQVIVKGAARDQADRYGSADEFLDALNNALQPRRLGPLEWLRRMIGAG